jgi:hypothetical protein
MTKPNISPGQLGYTIPEFCAAARLGQTTVYALIRDGKLRVKKFGRRTIVPIEEAKRIMSLDNVEQQVMEGRATGPGSCRLGVG